MSYDLLWSDNSEAEVVIHSFIPFGGSINKKSMKRICLIENSLLSSQITSMMAKFLQLLYSGEN